MAGLRFSIGTGIFLMSNVSRLNEAHESSVLIRNGGNVTEVSSQILTSTWC